MMKKKAMLLLAVIVSLLALVGWCSPEKVDRELSKGKLLLTQEQQTPETGG